MTGSAAARTSASKDAASGASMGSPGGDRVVPHPPHLASLALNGTRFFRPHLLQTTITPRSSIAKAMVTG
jgi:hypothetical protein